MKEIFPGIYESKKKIYTENILKGTRLFGDEIISSDGKEYRSFDPRRSKLAAAIVKGLRNTFINRDSKILYLGAAHGYTVSHISTIVSNGIIYGVEFSDRTFQEFLPVCQKLKNIVPILADARLTEKYFWIEEVDIVYCDIADPMQTDVAIKNAKEFLKNGGYLLLAIKSRSIDVTKSPKKVVKNEMSKLEKSGFEILDWKMLDPFERDHGFVVARIIT